MTDAPKRDTESAPPSVDLSHMTAAEAAMTIQLTAIGDQLKGISKTLLADSDWKHRVTDLLVAQGKAIEAILRKRGGKDEAIADGLRDLRVGLLPPYTDEDSETTQPGAQ